MKPVIWIDLSPEELELVEHALFVISWSDKDLQVVEALQARLRVASGDAE